MADRIDHNRADALDAARTAINLETRRYTRRMKSTAEARVNELFDDAQVTGRTFEPAKAAAEGVAAARAAYFAAELPAGEDDE